MVSANSCLPWLCFVRRPVVYSGVGRLYVGTSGWVYKGWARTFYPADLPLARQFAFYSTQFPSVEINNTFYRLPTEGAVRKWREQAPEGFIYAVKGSRFITHMKKLNVSSESIAIFFERVAPLREHLGPILWQLPPHLKKDAERLESFLRQLPKHFHYAMEFRHPSWLDNAIFALLRKFQIAHVSLSSMAMPRDLTITADFLYLRFHGLAGGAAHDYTTAELIPWARHCRSALRKGMSVYAYFNNDWNTRAPKNALEFIKLVEAPGRRRSPLQKPLQLLQ